MCSNVVPLQLFVPVNHLRIMRGIAVCTWRRQSIKIGIIHRYREQHTTTICQIPFNLGFRQLENISGIPHHPYSLHPHDHMLMKNTVRILPIQIAKPFYSPATCGNVSSTRLALSRATSMLAIRHALLGSLSFRSDTPS